MNNQFSFYPHPGGKNSTEANIFIHGYSAGHNEESREVLQASIPDSTHSCVNIFAFWSSGHFTHANTSSLELLRASAKVHWAAVPAAFVGDRATHFWKIRSRADAMGAVFISQLDDFLRNNHPKVETINLIGHSLGARVIISTLQAALAGASLRHYSINNVLLMGAAVEVVSANALQLCDMVSGRIINAYSSVDKVLLLNVGESCAGRKPVEHFDNIEMVGFGHMDYWPNLPEVMLKVKFNSLLKKNYVKGGAPQIDKQGYLNLLCSHNSLDFSLTGVEPCDIHGVLIKELGRFAETLIKNSAEIELSPLQAEVLESVSSTYTQMLGELSRLQSVVEWDRLNLVFFGERHSGKSTLIEVLRIFLSEPSRLATSENFSELVGQYKSEENDDESPGETVGFNVQAGEFEKDRSVLQRLDRKISSFLDASGNLATLTRRDVLRNVLPKAPSFKSAKNANLDLLEKSFTKSLVDANPCSDISRFTDVSTPANSYVLADADETKLNNPGARADGAIIGGGSRIYAETTANRYCIDLEKKRLSIIDLPGVDSSNKNYVAEIAPYLNCAHVIFYVIDAIQYFDDGFLKDLFDRFDGVLGSQSELWIIFNKKVTSPATLSVSNSELIKNDEKSSLSWLDKRMKQQLGARYGGIVALSAGVGLYAFSEHFLPGSQLEMRKRKFSRKFNFNDLASLSQMGRFVATLEENVVSKAASRIVRANLNRVYYSVRCGKKALDSELHRLRKISASMTLDAKIASEQLDISFNALMQRLEASGELHIENLVRQTRKTVYNLIDQGAGNSAFKDCLISTLAAQQDRLGDSVFELMEVEVERFQVDISYIFNRLETRTNDQINAYMQPEKSSYVGFKTRNQLKNELTTETLAATAAGGVLAVLGTGGWGLAIGAAGIASTLASTLWNHLDVERKKSQQRKVTESHLSAVKLQWIDELRDHLSARHPELRKRLDVLNQAIIDHGRHTVVALETLSIPIHHLQSLSNQLSQLDYLK